MSTFTLPISQLTNVEIGTQIPLLANEYFARGLIIGQSANARDNSNQLYGIYRSLDAVKADYGVEVPEYLIAKQYFAQDPRPKDIMIATVNHATAGEGGATGLSGITCAGANPYLLFHTDNVIFAQNASIRIEALVNTTDLNNNSLTQNYDFVVPLTNSNYIVRSSDFNIDSIQYFYVGVNANFGFDGLPKTSDINISMGMIVQPCSVRLKISFNNTVPLNFSEVFGQNPCWNIDSNVLTLCLSNQ